MIYILITDINIFKNLSKNSHERINFKCDYCKENYSKEFRICIKDLNCKHYCRNCIKIKNIDKFLENIDYENKDYLIEHLKNNSLVLSGVYCLTNKLNNKIYIGSSKDILKRWNSHLLDIKNKEHHCEEFNYLRLEDIKFEILKLENDLSKLIDLEFKLIEEYSKNFVLINSMRKIRNSKNNYADKKSLDSRIKLSKFEKIEDIENVKVLLYEGETSKYIAELYKVSETTIHSIKKGKTFKDVKSELNDMIYDVKAIDLNKGVNNSSSKLKEFQVCEIKKKINSENFTMTAIAKEYGVSRTLISHIKNGKLWSHVI